MASCGFAGLVVFCFCSCWPGAAPRRTLQSMSFMAAIQTTARIAAQMEEPPQQVPRHNTSLTRLWRQHDLADSIVKLLPTQSLAVLPTLSKAFERDKFRMLLVAMRASGSAGACTGALLSTLQTSGRDRGHYHCTWSKHPRPGWSFNGNPPLDLTHVCEDFPGEPNPRRHYLKAVRRGQYDRKKAICLDHEDISSSCPSGNRRCVRRVRFQFGYEGPTDEWGTAPGMSFALRGQDPPFSTILQFYNVFSPDGLNIMCSGGSRNGGDVCHITTIPKDLVSEPGQEEDCLKSVTIDAELDWNSCSACVRTTTDWDGVEFIDFCEFDRLPLKCLQLAFYGGGDHFVGDIDLWYYDMPTPPTRHHVPFAPCRDDKLRVVVPHALGEGPIFLGSPALGLPHHGN